MNITRKYGTRTNFWAQLMIAVAAIFIASAIFAVGAAQGHAGESALIAGILITLVGCTLNKPKARACLVTLSVPEILADVMDAFKIETPELFGPNGIATDMSSQTAVLGDKVTAKISHVPVTGDYDANNGGFENGVQQVTDLIEDVPVTLDRFKTVAVNISWMTQLASKIDLYKEAVRNYGYALSKLVIDTVLAQATPANFSNQVALPVANITLDTFDGTIRDQMNAQKMANRGRFAIINTAAASKFGQDDRTRSSFFYNQRNGEEGYRKWSNIGGFSWIREYPDMPANDNNWGYAGEKRGIVFCARGIQYSNAAEQLGIPQVMKFFSVTDESKGLPLTGVGYQKAGTGDVIVAVGMLFGIGAGKQGGNAGTITDNGGVRLVTQ